MDSVTQFAFGSAIGAAILGPRIGARKAVVLGGLMGTAPDLDVFFPFEDPVDAFVLHRGVTHAFFAQALATPILGEIARLLTPGLKQNTRTRLYIAIFTILATHAILDALTIYGTRLFWPFWPEPIGIGSIFIIDPIYTVPLITVSLWGLIIGGWGSLLRKSTVGALAFSTLYLGWSLVGQSWAEDRARAALDRAGISSQVTQTIATPMPFNTVFWRTIAMVPGGYINVYDSLLGPEGDISLYRHHSKGPGCLADDEDFRTLAGFSKGFWTLTSTEAGDVLISDLRMGVTPNYVFTFKVATRDGPVETPARVKSAERNGPGDVDWLISAIFGDLGIRSMEAEALFDQSEALTWDWEQAC